MRRILLTLPAMAAADADAIATSQSAAGAENLTLDGTLATDGVASLDISRRVGIASAGDDTGITFTVTGTNRHGATISETVDGANAGTAETELDFATVTRVATSGATASTVEVGTTDQASSAWAPLDHYQTPFHVSVALQNVEGGTYDVEHTFDPMMRRSPSDPPAVFAHDSLTGQTGAEDGNYSFPIAAVRFTRTAGTAAAEMSVQQAGVRGG